MHNFVFALEGGFQVLAVGLLLGAGLPLIFALGVRSLAYGTNATTQSDSQPHPLGKVLGALCFAIVLVAVALGITFIVASGFGMALSFEHIYPTLVPK